MPGADAFLQISTLGHLQRESPPFPALLAKNMLTCVGSSLGLLWIWISLVVHLLFALFSPLELCLTSSTLLSIQYTPLKPFNFFVSPSMIFMPTNPFLLSLAFVRTLICPSSTPWFIMLTLLSCLVQQTTTILSTQSVSTLILQRMHIVQLITIMNMHR